MEDKLRALIAAIEQKIDPNFDFDVEHWDWGNFDDSFGYGYDCGKEQILRDILKQLKAILPQD